MKESAVFIIRLGSTEPVKGDIDAMKQIRPDLNSIGTSIPCGTLSIAMTSKTIPEIMQIYAQINDTMPVIVFKAEDSSVAGIDLTLPHINDAIENFNSMYNTNIPTRPASQPQPKSPESLEELLGQMEQDLSEAEAEFQDSTVCELTLDDLLDKITRVGMDKLSQSELARLKSF